MKKLARLTALLLTGALLLVLTACGAVAEPEPETEQQAKQRLLDEINNYRTSIRLDTLEEVEQLSAAQQELMNSFRAAGKTVLPESEGDEAIDRWWSMTEGWHSCGGFGGGLHDDESGWIYTLGAMVPANTPEGKAELWATLKDAGVFNNSNCTSIGIGVVTIDGQMYWISEVFYK